MRGRRGVVWCGSGWVGDSKVQVVVGEAARHRIHTPRVRRPVDEAPVAQHLLPQKALGCASCVFVTPAQRQLRVSTPGAGCGAASAPRRQAAACQARPKDRKKR